MKIFMLFLAATLVFASMPLHAAPKPRTMKSRATAPAFADFDRRAKAGERLNVVFFGASLTWGANASDPQLTSYRARVAEKFEKAYPKARFKFWDAAIGGTGSQLGVFRFERDVLRRRPDLVFLDFTLNDDHWGLDTERLASYESLVRRTIVEARCPLVLVLFPGAGEVRQPDTALPRSAAHRAIAATYGAGIGDAVVLMRRLVRANPALVDVWWPHPKDKTHPGDVGYERYADAAWHGYRQAVRARRVCRVPARMLHGDTYLHWSRNRLSQMGPLPAGWSVGRPNRISAWYDSLMSRWLDDETIASPGAAPWKFTFHGSMVMLYGEMTPQSGKLKVLIDGEPPPGKSKGVFDLVSKAGGNVKLSQLVVEGLDATQPHTIELIPQLDAGQEVRIESLCIAGGNATISRAQN